MLQFIPVFEDNTIAIRASGKLTHEDYQAFLPELEKQIKELGKVSVLFELDNFSGWDLKAAKDDFEFGMKHMNDFERIAIVGDKAWEHWMVLMMKPFMPYGEVRYFERENLQEAWDWLREPAEEEKAANQLTPYKEIMVGVDFSNYSRHAAKRAIEIAKFYQANVTLLHVTEEIIPYAYYYDDSMLGYPFEPELVVEQNKEQVKMAKKQMAAFMDDLGDTDGVKSEVLSGDTGSTIVSFLEAQKTDLAVFGAKKKKGISKLLGSTPHYIQNHSRCEVLVAPLQESSTFAEQNK